MANKNQTENDSEDAAIEERVRKMLDPALPDEPEPVATAMPTGVSSITQPSAPEIGELPKPKEPLQIKIIKAGETAPEVVPVAKPEVKPELKPMPIPINTESAPKIPEPGPLNNPVINPEPPQPAEPVPTEQDIKPVVEDDQTAKAVDDIVAHESDELLAAQDEKRSKETEPAKKKKGSSSKKFIIKLLIWAILLGVAAAAIYPTSRYYVLNAAGVRSTTSVRVIDNSTQRPLKNVQVSVNGASAATDENGDATLQEVKLGDGELKIEKRAFAVQTYNVTIGWGSNPMGEYKLTPSGTQYAINVKDYLSGKGIVKAEAVSGEASAYSDEDGMILLTLAEPPDKFEVTITASGYRTEKVKINGDTKKATDVRLVPTRKHVYVVNKEGRFDIYKKDIDGKNEQLVLRGTGSEREDMILIPHPSDDVVALVSTRTGNQNKAGELLSTLTVIDLRTNATEEVDTVEKLQLVDWVGDRIVYAFTTPNAADNDPKRDKLMSYNYKDNDRTEIAAANHFISTVVADGHLYYAPAGDYQNGVNVSLFRVQADGRNREVILDEEIQSLSHVAYDKLVMSTPKGWFEYQLGKQPAKLKAKPAEISYKVYVANPDGSKSLWVDSREGKGVLIVRTKAGGKEKTVYSIEGLDYPVRWINKTSIVFRVNTDAETADYAVSTEGGPVKRIGDVVNTIGIDQWVY